MELFTIKRLIFKKEEKKNINTMKLKSWYNLMQFTRQHLTYIFLKVVNNFVGTGSPIMFSLKTSICSLINMRANSVYKNRKKHNTPAGGPHPQHVTWYERCHTISACYRSGVSIPLSYFCIIIIALLPSLIPFQTNYYNENGGCDRCTFVPWNFLNSPKAKVAYLHFITKGTFRLHGQ